MTERQSSQVMAKPRRYMERRFAPLEGEVREDDAGLHYAGHASVFDQEVDFGFFREQVAKGAFRKTIGDGADVRFLFNHDPSTVMARTTAGTLRLKEDKDGLAVDADLDPEDRDVQRLVPKLRSGNVSQMSFGFSVVREDVTDEDTDSPLRTIREAELFDVSSVTFPAYEGAEGGLRDMYGFLGLPLTLKRSTLDNVLDEIQDLDEQADPERIRAAIAKLSAQLPPEPEPLEEHSESTDLPLERKRRLLDQERNRIAVA